MAFSQESAPQQVTMSGSPARPYDGGTWTAAESGAYIAVSIQAVDISSPAVAAHAAKYRVTAVPTDGSQTLVCYSNNLTLQPGYKWPDQTLQVLNPIPGTVYNVTVALDDDAETG